MSDVAHNRASTPSIGADELSGMLDISVEELRMHIANNDISDGDVLDATSDMSVRVRRWSIRAAVDIVMAEQKQAPLEWLRQMLRTEVDT